jgi:hypothetical protein
VRFPDITAMGLSFPARMLGPAIASELSKFTMITPASRSAERPAVPL